MNWVDQLKNSMPDNVNDAKLDLDVIENSQFQLVEAEAMALAAAFATGNTKFWKWLDSQIENRQEARAAITAASLIVTDNVYWPFLNMSADQTLINSLPLHEKISKSARLTHGGTTQARFELYNLAASAVTKCHYCITRWYSSLKDQGYTVEQLNDLARIAAVIATVSRIWDN